MKNLFIAFTMIFIFCLVGCGEKQNVDVSDNTVEIQDNNVNLTENEETSDDNVINLSKMMEYASENPNRDFSKYDKNSNYFGMTARVGTKNNPIKIGEVGIASATTPEVDENGKYNFANQYGLDYFVRVIRRLNQEELNKFFEEDYLANYVFSEDSSLKGVLLEIDFNNNPLFINGIKEGSDRRDTILKTSSPNIVDGNYHSSIDHIVAIPYDSENLEDNKMCIIWSISDNNEYDGLLRLGGYVGKTLNPEDYFFSFFEI